MKVYNKPNTILHIVGHAMLV